MKRIHGGEAVTSDVRRDVKSRDESPGGGAEPNGPTFLGASATLPGAGPPGGNKSIKAWRLEQKQPRPQGSCARAERQGRRPVEGTPPRRTSLGARALRYPGGPHLPRNSLLPRGNWLPNPSPRLSAGLFLNLSVHSAGTALGCSASAG